MNQAYINFSLLMMITLLGVLGVFSGLSLYADGAYSLLMILQSHQFFDFYTARRFVQIITQAPVVFGVKSGITNLNLLIYLHSFGVIFIPLVFWLAALIKQFKSDLFWFYILAFCISYLNTGLFAIGEYNLTFAMVAFCASILMQKNRLKIWDNFFLIITAFCLILSYQAMLFLGPLLCYLSFKRSITFTRFNCENLSFILFLTSTFIALGSILFPRDPSGLFGALGNILLMLFSTQFIYILLMLFLITKDSNNKLIFCLACFLSIAHAINYHFWNSPEINYDFRALAGLLLAAVLFIASNLEYRTIIKRTPILILFFFSMIIPFYIQVIDFALMTSKYEHFVRTHQGMINIEKTNLKQSRYYWKWNNPCLSLLLRGDQKGAIIANDSKYKGWQPFDPLSIQANLFHYQKPKPLYQFAFQDAFLRRLYK